MNCFIFYCVSLTFRINFSVESKFYFLSLIFYPSKVSLIYLKLHNPGKSMVSILIDDEKHQTISPHQSLHDQHIFLPIDKNFNYDNYDEDVFYNDHVKN